MNIGDWVRRPNRKSGATSMLRAVSAFGDHISEVVAPRSEPEMVRANAEAHSAYSQSALLGVVATAAALLSGIVQMNPR